MKRIMIVAGEASGDLHGASLVEAYQAIDPDARFFGVGGSRMAEAGVDIVFDSSQVAVVGLFEVVKHLPVIREVLSWVREALEVGKPDAVVLIDFPDFNFRVAAAARKAGVPVFYYISPQVWAWRRGRVKFLAKNVSQMAVIFPFEVPFYEAAGLPAEFVGHPLMDHDDTRQRPAREEARRRLGLDADLRVVALLPGSRNSELGHNLPTLAKAAGQIRAQITNTHFVIPVASTLRASDIEALWNTSGGGDAPLHITEEPAGVALAAADAAAVCSGTATLEAALAGVPSVVVYRLNPVTYFFGRMLVRVSHVGLVNLVAGRTVAPELIQKDFTPEAVTEEITRFLTDEARHREVVEGLAEVRERLGAAGASTRAAELLHDVVGRDG